jgi:hypothetical protein
MPIEAWIVAGTCIALELFCIIMMFVLSWSSDYVHGAQFSTQPSPLRQKGGMKPSAMRPPQPPYKHIGHVVIPITNIKPGMAPKKR